MTGRRVVITGLGLSTALGLDVEETWQKALAGESGIRKLHLPGGGKSPVQAVGQVSPEDWETIRNTFKSKCPQQGERRTLFALWSAQAALHDARLTDFDGGKGRHGVALAAGLGINRLEDIQRWLVPDGRFDYGAFAGQIGDIHEESIMKNPSDRPAALIADTFGMTGYNCTVTTACASAAQAIGIAYRAIRRGDADVMIAGGADSMINPVGLVFFVLLGAASTLPDDPRTLCRPFDRKRSGLVMGEGAGIVVLEEESHARKRGAFIHAEVAGYGTSMDAYQVTAPHPRGIGAEQAMRGALADSGLAPDQIDYINAHGTSTKLNDAAETLAIRNVFREHAFRLAVNSSKSLIGHLLAASGGPEFVFTALSVSRDEIHPTINLHNPDPRCDLDYVPGEKRIKPLRAALTNSFGFGGQNAALAVKKYA